MNKIILNSLTIAALSIVMYMLLIAVVGFEQKKAMFVAGGAGLAMIIVDAIIMKGKRI